MSRRLHVVTHPEVRVEPDVREWGLSADGCRRVVVAAVQRCLAQAPAGDVAVVAHGAVGTLLWCHLAGEPIDRRHDQPGQGSWYSVDTTTGRPSSPWCRIPAS